MIEIQNYAPYIQLAVAFDFACVAFKDIKSNNREKIYNTISNFSKIGTDLIDKYEKDIDSYINKKEINVFKPFQLPFENYFKESLKKKGDQLKAIKEMDAFYFGPVALISGIYSTVALLLIGEIDQYDSLKNIYTYLTEFTFLIIGVFVIIEIKANIQAVREKKISTVSRAYVYSLAAMILSIVISSYLGFMGKNWGELPFKDINFTDISRYSLIIPYIAFIGVFCWFTLFIIASAFQIALIKVTRMRQKSFIKKVSAPINKYQVKIDDYSDLEIIKTKDLIYPSIKKEESRNDKVNIFKFDFGKRSLSQIKSKKNILKKTTKKNMRKNKRRKR